MPTILLLTACVLGETGYGPEQADYLRSLQPSTVYLGDYGGQPVSIAEHAPQENDVPKLLRTKDNVTLLQVREGAAPIEVRLDYPNRAARTFKVIPFEGSVRILDDVQAMRLDNLARGSIGLLKCDEYLITHYAMFLFGSLILCGRKLPKESCVPWQIAMKTSLGATALTIPTSGFYFWAIRLEVDMRIWAATVIAFYLTGVLMHRFRIEKTDGIGIFRHPVAIA